MLHAESTRRWQSWMLAGLLFGTAVLVLPAAVEPFMLPKATLAWVLAAVLVALWLVRVVHTRRLVLPTSPVGVSAGLFALALLIATVTSPSPWTSVVGTYSRYTGLISYLVYLAVFLVAVRIADLALARFLARTALVALGLVVAYGLVQVVGADPLDYAGLGVGTRFSFLGNTNFAGAWAGCVAALALMTALSTDERIGWRIYGASVLLLGVVYAGLTTTSQGPAVAAVAVGFTAIVVVTEKGTRLRSFAVDHKGPTAVAILAIAVVALVAVASSLGSLRAQLDQALVERPEFWSTAWEIYRDHPVVGTGLDTYGHHFLAFRSPEHAVLVGPVKTDAPHSVPLGMLANGGTLLGLTYLTFVFLVGFALIKAVRSARGSTRVHLAGWGGVWLGYQAQSLVSFDVPPLAVLHYLSAGLIIGLAPSMRWRTVQLPGVAASRRVNRQGREYGDVVVPDSTRVLQGAAAIVAIIGLWFSLYPLRADLQAASAAPLASSGEFSEATERFESAANLNPSEGSYPFLSARGHEAAGRPQAALEAAAEAARRDPGAVQYALFAARQAQVLEDEELARSYYEEALRRDPHDPPVLNEVAVFLHEVGDLAAADQLLQRSLEVEPGNVDARALLNDLRSR